AELVHLERPPTVAHPLLGVENTALAVELDGNSRHQKQRNQQRQEQEHHEKVHHPLEPQIKDRGLQVPKNILRNVFDAHPPGKRLRQLLNIEHRNMRQSTGSEKTLPLIRQVFRMQVSHNPVVAPPVEVWTLQHGNDRT